MTKVAIVGPAGPWGHDHARLAAELVHFHRVRQLPGTLQVDADGPSGVHGTAVWAPAPRPTNGQMGPTLWGTARAVMALCRAVVQDSQVILLLSPTGAFALPLVRRLSKARIITVMPPQAELTSATANIGHWWTRWTARLAGRYSDILVAGQTDEARRLTQAYGKACQVIGRGVDPIPVDTGPHQAPGLPARFALALCKIDPEHQVDMVLEAFAQRPGLPLVMVADWGLSAHGQALRQRYAVHAHLHLLDPIDDEMALCRLQRQAALYVHSAASEGSQATLIAMMHLGKPILAFDSLPNRHATEGQALWFRDAASLHETATYWPLDELAQVGARLRRIAQDRHSWSAVGQAYFHLILQPLS